MNLKMKQMKMSHLMTRKMMVAAIMGKMISRYVVKVCQVKNLEHCFLLDTGIKTNIQFGQVVICLVDRLACRAYGCSCSPLLFWISRLILC